MQVISIYRSRFRSFPRQLSQHHTISVGALPSRFLRGQSLSSLSSSVTVSPVKKIIRRENEVIVEWKEGSSVFNNIWLRDHCRCPECFHSVTRQRLGNTFDLVHQIPQDVTITNDGLKVMWKEASNPPSKLHESVYPWKWLREMPLAVHRHTSTPGPTKSGITPLTRHYWSSMISECPPSVEYEAVIQSEDAVLTWLENVYYHGFCFVKGVPVDPMSTEALIKRIAFIRGTHYGGFWDFAADLAHGDTAYTNIALKAHTDTTYFTDPCGLQIFHLLSHTEGLGGKSLLVDGFRAASILRKKYPEDFEILSKTCVPTHSVGDALYKYTVVEEGYPIIQTRDGEPSMIRYNNDDRSVIRHMEPEDVTLWYRALVSWDRVLSAPDSEYWFQLEPGTVVVIDNHRVLHGRSAFTGKRRMCGAYIGRDDYLARLYALRDRDVYGEQKSSVWDPKL